MRPEPNLTEEERAAVRALIKLAGTWPKTLKLFSWSGSLVVLKPGDGRSADESIVASLGDRIPNDSGVPPVDEPC